MRNNKGKLIAVFNPSYHREGSTLVSMSLGIAMEYLYNVRVLLINKSGSMSYMERYVENEIDINFTMDSLKVFNSSISAKQIETFSTKINNNLYMIAGSNLPVDVAIEDEDFEENLIAESLASFDIVIVDMPTTVRKENLRYLTNADIVLAVMTADEIMLDDIFTKKSKKDVKQVLLQENTLAIINQMYESWNINNELGRLSKRYGFKNIAGLTYDGNVYKACTSNRNLYSFMQKELKEVKLPFPTQISELTEYIKDKMDLDVVDKVVVSKGFLDILFRGK